MSSEIPREETTPYTSDERDVRAATESQQHDFPYDRSEEAEVTRREFCTFLGLTSCALFAGAAGFAGKAVFDTRAAGPNASFTPMRIDGAAALAPNAALNFHYPTERDSAILVRDADGSYYAYGQKCTHLACPVYYEQARSRIECPCHEGSFDTKTGEVLGGPPPRPLDRIEVEVRDGEVWAVGRKAASHERSI